MWTESELEFIKENESYLEIAKLPLALSDKIDNWKLLHKLNIGLAVLRGEKFTITIYNSRNVNYKIAYLSLMSKYPPTSGQGRNLSMASFSKDSILSMSPKASTEFLILCNLAEMGLGPDREPHSYEKWLKLIYENIALTRWDDND